ncbi:Conserved_hypothetical protein [Hexamita inflata]|uniref:Uncharacterized protein n=1 Tax=Hexamita inflata TaxID=28002 RepID=A0AA86UQJ1_9EUKA|nr:Conserved hypothetical protein [Hexamita inflata]
MSDQVSLAQWLTPVALVVLSILWMTFVSRDKGKDIVELTKNQFTDQKLQPLDVINHKLKKEGKQELDKDKFNALYYKYLEEERKKFPLSSFLHRWLDKAPKQYLDQNTDKQKDKEE